MMMMMITTHTSVTIRTTAAIGMAIVDTQGVIGIPALSSSPHILALGSSQIEQRSVRVASTA